ncbi:MAG: MBL fold metallo-hydrolase [Treponema sp.]|nr:MBL fold metallo-hydrolase [Treponema sp.]
MKVTKVQGKLELKNSGGLSLFFIGAGSAFSKVNFQNNVIFIKGKEHILIDCGTLCPLAILQYGVKISEIKNFFLTHSHADHIGGMEEVAFTDYYSKKTPPVVVIDDKFKKILWNESLRGGLGYSKTFDGRTAGFDDFFTQQKPVKVKCGKHYYQQAFIGGKNGIDLKVFETSHSNARDSRGRVFHSSGVVVDNRILFTGDTKFNRKQLDGILGDFEIEWIFHDVCYYQNEVHASYKDLLTLPADIKKKIYLCHYDEPLLEKNPKKDGFAGFVKRGCYYNFDL